MAVKPSKRSIEFHRAGEAHSSLLIVPGASPNNRPERIAHAVGKWEETRRNYPGSFSPYVVDFLQVFPTGIREV